MARGRGESHKAFKFSGQSEIEPCELWRKRTNTPELFHSLTDITREKAGLYAAAWKGEIGLDAAHKMRLHLDSIQASLVATNDDRRKDRELELKVVAAEETEKRLEAIEEMLRQAGGA